MLSVGRNHYHATIGTFLIEYYVDRYGHYIPMQYTSSLDGRIDACASTVDCVVVSWVSGAASGSCYTKSTAGRARPNAAIFGANLVSEHALNTRSTVQMRGKQIDARSSITFGYGGLDATYISERTPLTEYSTILKTVTK